MKQYKGELLASCLQLLLSLPIELVTEEIGSLVPAVQVSSQGLDGRDPSPLSTHFGHLGHPQSYGVPHTHRSPPVIWCPSHTGHPQSYGVPHTHRSPPVIWCPSHTGHPQSYGVPHTQVTPSHMVSLTHTGHLQSYGVPHTHRSPPVIWCPSHTGHPQSYMYGVPHTQVTPSHTCMVSLIHRSPSS